MGIHNFFRGAPMRKVLLACLMVLFGSPVFAQGPSPEAQKKHRVGLVKVIGGIGAAGLGSTFALIGGFGNSRSETGGFLPLGLAMMGGGGYLIWNGIGDMDRSKNMPALGFTVTKKGAAVAFRKSW
jgi:hypothetical protein